MSAPQIHYFGIRHHGPGSTKRLLAALQALNPQKVLIEGPADCSELLPMLAAQEMRPPVALLGYLADSPDISLYYPFADFSPEYQACCWAIGARSQVAFIDWPLKLQLAKIVADKAIAEELPEELESLLVSDSDSDSDRKEDEANCSAKDDVSTLKQDLGADPIGVLAALAGYEDGEGWWNDLIEQNSDGDSAIFETVELAMTALRESIAHEQILERDRIREAFMRLEIAQHAKECEGPIAVICGAWHVPAFRQKHSIKNDRALINQLPKALAKTKVKSTWVPWTSPRLAFASGYGAGVDAPMWYQHIWEHGGSNDTLESWLSFVAKNLRDCGHIVSTASVIEAVRLSTSLAAVRNRPAPGFEEIREAVIACLCFGEPLLWLQLEKTLLMGSVVGEIPASAPLAPLLEDLQTQQKKHKLKPEALERELSLDLRSASGFGKSILLHRLRILDVPWGRQTDTGSSRGTFRECWHLTWQPEFSVRLVEHLVYGSTLEQAANNKIIEQISTETKLSKLAELVQLCLEAQLDSAAQQALNKLDQRAAQATDCVELMESLPPMVAIYRYGTARAISLEHIGELIIRLTTQAAIALPYACRNLNDEEAEHYRCSLGAAHQAITLSELASDLLLNWQKSLHVVVASLKSSRQLSGLCARLLYQDKHLTKDALAQLLQRLLSPGTAVADAARFFDGFFTDAVQRLLYDTVLLNAVEQWLLHLDTEEFTENLPLFRRIFSSLDAMERKRMIDTVLQATKHASENVCVNPEAIALWPNQLVRLGSLIARESDWNQ